MKCSYPYFLTFYIFFISFSLKINFLMPLLLLPVLKIFPTFTSSTALCKKIFKASTIQSNWNRSLLLDRKNLHGFLCFLFFVLSLFFCHLLLPWFDIKKSADSKKISTFHDSKLLVLNYLAHTLNDEIEKKS